MEDKIDIVVLWVDGNDPKWQKEYRKYKPTAEFDYVRFRDWGLMKYWFRGVEKFMPWINNIYFVTCGQVPSWLNLSHEKLVHVKHEDYIPQQYLPTFNSNTIDFFINRIEGLSEKFIYFNDDLFVISAVTPERFFHKGLPCDIVLEGGYKALHDGFSRVFYNNIAYVNQSFNKRNVVKKHFKKWFSLKYGKNVFNNLMMQIFPYFINFTPSHLPQPFLKNTYNEVYSKYGIEMELRTTTRFRTDDNITQYLIREWQLLTGNFHPYNIYKDSHCYYITDENILKLKESIKSQKYSILCLNDNSLIKHFETDKMILVEAFESILPEKSKFEI